MKLLFIQDALVNAGAERSHLEILSRFSKEIEVVFVYFYPKHDLKEEYDKAGIRLIFLDLPESYHFRLAVSRLVKVIRREKPDLLISSLWRADIITRIASLITGVPLVGTLVNDSYAPIAWKDKKGLKYKGVYWLDRLTAGIPKHWIANAQALASSHVKTLGLDAEKISVVYRGRSITEVSWERMEKGSPDSYREVNGRVGIGRLEKERLESEGIENERIKPYSFISYGRLLERKGFQDAIQSFSKVIQKYPNCSLTIYGEGPYRSHLEAIIAKLGLKGKVILPGKFGSESNNYQSSKNNEIATSSLGTPRNDDPLSKAIGTPNLNPPNPLNLSSLNPLNLLLSSDCFLFPSWYEGFSGALVEAMMAGIPIIASDISMNLEAVSPENALIFEVQNIDQLANQMIFSIEHPDLMIDLGVKAREEAIARFDIEKIANDYEQTLQRIYKRLKSKL